MKNNLKKRILSLMLAVVMVFGMIPSASLTAFAADYKMNWQLRAAVPAYINSVK